MKQIKINHLKRGNLLRINDDLNAPLFVRSEYDRKEKKYKCYFIDSIGNKYPSFIFIKSETFVWIRK